MDFPRCTKAKLIHTDGRVWSEPLHRHLGGKRYQDFIRFNMKHKSRVTFTQGAPDGGIFAPVVVEEFLRNGKK